MKAATIVPQKYLHLIENQTYHMALAHLIGKAGFEDYSAFYELKGKQDDKFLIMDNGLIEGDPRPIEEIVEKAKLLYASELVLPDVFRDSPATLSAVERAFDYIYDNGIYDLKVMAVAQGNTYEEWLANARELLKLPINTLGIPKVLTKLPYYKMTPGGFTTYEKDGYWLQRLEALQALRVDLDATDVEIHLLGCWDTPLEAKRIANAVASGDCHEVRGIDSAIPWVYANAGMKMSEGERPVGPVDFGATNLDADDLTLKYNIHMWQRECADIDLEAPDKDIPYFW
ncbi:hypothetical protein D3C75_136180 [compost metagenome]